MSGTVQFPVGPSMAKTSHISLDRTVTRTILERNFMKQSWVLTNMIFPECIFGVIKKEAPFVDNEQYSLTVKLMETKSDCVCVCTQT